ncbi:MAG: prolipoprotein diacylglyceryl transferase [Eubacterium sp.]|nr:prolipoprotein diacylglyceryl transferase [Eubacterium sp.]
MYIPKLKYTFYTPIVLSSIVIGVAVSCLLMKKAGAKKETIRYTALFTFISILLFSYLMGINLSGNIYQVGFVGAGGALGLIVGAIGSALIHRDHIRDSVAAWIIVAPLMYGLSKISCHIAGCCNGIPYKGPFCVSYGVKNGKCFFPVQLLEVVVFLLIFVCGLTLYMKGKERLRVAEIVLVISALSKVGIEFLRESHMGKIVSGYQVIVLLIACGGVIGMERIRKIRKS